MRDARQHSERRIEEIIDPEEKSSGGPKNTSAICLTFEQLHSGIETSWRLVDGHGKYIEPGGGHVRTISGHRAKH